MKFCALLLLPAIVTSCGINYNSWYDGWCFKIAYGYNTFYPTAVKTCEGDNAALSSVYSEEENTLLYNSAYKDAKSQSIQFWIGLQCNGEKYVWADGTDANYTNFAEDYICSSATKDQHFYISYDLKWHRSVDVNYNIPYIVCKASKRSSGACDDFDVISTGKGGETCYKLQEDPMNWQNAQSSCEKQHAYISVIHDQTLNDFVRRTGVSNGWMDGMHIGLSVDKNGNYSWADGSKVDYQNYASGFPNQVYGDCVAMETGFLPGQWMNVDCYSTKLPYLCTRQAFIASDPQPAGCPVSNQFTTGDDVYSPSYPQASGANACDYVLLEPNQNKKVTLDIEFFESNLCCDTLTVYDGLFGNTVLKTFSGYYGSKIQTIFASSNSMRLRWNATNGAHVRGFHAVVNSV